MKIRILSSMISLVLLVLVIALAAGCSSLYQAEQAVDQIEEQMEQKADQVEEQLENAAKPPVSPAVTQNAAALTLEQAQEIALNHAGVSAANADFIRVELDYDDGIKVYEIEFDAGDFEYEYEINAKSGKIRDYDKEYRWD